MNPEKYGISRGEKVSEILNLFAQPILRELMAEGKWGVLEEHEAAMELACMTWNAVALADDWGDDSALKEYHHLLSTVPTDKREFGKTLIDLIKVKRGPFRKYRFVFGDLKVSIGDDGKPCTFAEATIPPGKSLTPIAE